MHAQTKSLSPTDHQHSCFHPEFSGVRLQGRVRLEHGDRESSRVGSNSNHGVIKRERRP